MSDNVKGDKIGGDKVAGNKVVNKGNTLHVKNAGVVAGGDALLENVNFKQHISSEERSVPDDLAGQIALLREELKKWARAEEDAGRDTSDVDQAIGTVTAAKAAIDAGEESSAKRHLATAGAWVFDFATKVGVTLVTEVIKQQTGLR